MWARVKIDKPKTEFAIQVTGRRFNWEVLYPGPDGKFGTQDDKQFLDELHVPVNRPVRLGGHPVRGVRDLHLPRIRPEPSGRGVLAPSRRVGRGGS